MKVPISYVNILNLPPEIVPATLKRPTRPEGAKTAKRGMTDLNYDYESIEVFIRPCEYL